MSERELIQQLDRALSEMLSGASLGSTGPEVTDLLRVGSMVRDLPDEGFRAELKGRLMAQIKKEKQKMTPTVNWIREGFHSLTPYLHAPRSARLMEFMRDAFGGVERQRVLRPDGAIMHGEMQIGDSIIEMGEDPPAQWRLGGTSLHYRVPDVDAAYGRALDAGGVSLYAPVDQEYGDREAGIKDPAGNYWFLATAKGQDYKKKGAHDVQPHLTPHGVPALIEFLQRAFGAEVMERHENPDGTVVYAGIKIGDSIMGMGEAHGQWQPMPAAIHLYVPDADAVYQSALAAGAESINGPQNQPYGERSATVRDTHGNHWYIATLIE